MIRHMGFCVAVLAAAAAGLPDSAASASPVFSTIPAEMIEARYAPAAGLLPNGTVLLAGGYNETPGKYLKSAEVFDPVSGTFTKLSAELNAVREEPATAPLPDGRLLIAGGYGGGLNSLKSAELFNPATNTFEALSAQMTAERDGPSAAALPDGRVLIVGGAASGKELKTAEVFNPGKGSFEALPAQMSVGRYWPAVATLPSGKVLIAGGDNESGSLKSAELFDPSTNSFEKLEGIGHELAERRREAAVAVLQSGKVLIAGGYNELVVQSAELFDPATSVFEGLSAGLIQPRVGPAGVLLRDGRMLVAGGYNETSLYQSRSAEETSVTAPSVTSTAATGVGVSAATLTGTVLTEALATAYFQYGTSGAYGSSTSGQSVAFTASPRSLGSAVGGLSPGTTYHFRVVAENAGGPSYGADQTFTTATVPVVPIPPSIASVTQSHNKWREGNALASVSRRRKRLPLGTTFSFSLNEQARVSLAFTQLVGGRKVNGKCVAPTPKNRRKHRCTRTATAGTLSFGGHVGINKVRFQGRISRSTKLKPGHYTLIITATNAAGRHSRPVRLSFTIVK
jgi:hypothetical protein